MFFSLMLWKLLGWGPLRKQCIIIIINIIIIMIIYGTINWSKCPSLSVSSGRVEVALDSKKISRLSPQANWIQFVYGHVPGSKQKKHYSLPASSRSTERVHGFIFICSVASPQCLVINATWTGGGLIGWLWKATVNVLTCSFLLLDILCNSQ